jgi:hypothetical protein
MSETTLIRPVAAPRQGVNDAVVADKGKQMAGDIIANFEAFAVGDRKGFDAHIIVSDAVHSAADTRLERYFREHNGQYGPETISTETGRVILQGIALEQTHTRLLMCKLGGVAVFADVRATDGIITDKHYWSSAPAEADSGNL